MQSPMTPGRGLKNRCIVVLPFSKRTLSRVRIGSITQPVADEVEQNHRQHHEENRREKPRVVRYGIDILRILQQRSPTHVRSRNTKAKKAQRGFTQDHARNRQRDRHHQETCYPWQQMAEDNLHRFRRRDSRSEISFPRTTRARPDQPTNDNTRVMAKNFCIPDHSFGMAADSAIHTGIWGMLMMNSMMR